MMNKEEFLRTLGAALSGEVPQHIIQENIRYYDNYISGELAKGRSEDEVMDELGGPRLIARTIIDAAEAGGEAIGDEDVSGENSGFNQTYGSFGQDEDNMGQGGSFHMYNLNTWYWKLAGVVLLALVMFLVITVIGGIASLLLSPVGLILIIFLILWRNQR